MVFYGMVMLNLLANTTEGGAEYTNLILLFALIVIGGTFGARLFQKFHIPQVVGCIVIGIFLREVLGLITAEQLDRLRPFTMFALGIIGFMIGSELRGDIFKKYGKQFFIILLSEGIGAFLLVAIGSSIVVWFVLPDMIEGINWAERIHISTAIGLILGAISSATAPAATANVLWEYKTRGPLTATVLAIVALDDALALLLYRAAATGAKALFGTGHDSILMTIFVLLGEIVGSIALGILTGLLLYFLLKFVKAKDKILEFTIGCLLLVVGISIIPGIDPILPAMVLGVTIANLMPRQSKNTFKLVEKFSPPIYISFFVLAGAHVEFAKLAVWVIVMIAVYILCRVFGKVIGANLGARYSGSAVTVRRYLGICLQAQAGVAIGLAILAGQQFNSELGHTIIMIVMTATFVTEIFGPMMVKYGVKKAGEVGLNITEDDLIKTYRVRDVMEKDVPIINTGTLLSEVIQIVSDTDNFYYCVVDNKGNITGSITLEGVRKTFTTHELNDWLVALDIMQPVITKITPEVELSEALEKAKQLDLEYIPVVAQPEDNKLIGIMDYRVIRRMLTAEVLSRQQKADSMHAVS